MITMHLFSFCKKEQKNLAENKGGKNAKKKKELA